MTRPSRRGQNSNTSPCGCGFPEQMLRLSYSYAALDREMNGWCPMIRKTTRPSPNTRGQSEASARRSFALISSTIEKLNTSNYVPLLCMALLATVDLRKTKASLYWSRFDNTPPSLSHLATSPHGKIESEAKATFLVWPVPELVSGNGLRHHLALIRLFEQG